MGTGSLVPVPLPVVADDEGDRAALERRDRARPRLGNVRLSAFRDRFPPRSAVVSRGVSASRHRLQLPSGARLVPVVAEQAGDRHPYDTRAVLPDVGHAEGGAHVGVRGAAGERGSEGVRVGNAAGHIRAYVVPTARPQPVDPGAPLVRVELGGILKIGYAAYAGLLRHPALVPDVSVPAALVGRHDDPRRLRRGAFRRFQPGPPGPVPLDIDARLPGAAFRQPGPLGSEHRQLAVRCFVPTAPVPSRLGSRRSAYASPRVRVSTAMWGSPPRAVLSP